MKGRGALGHRGGELDEVVQHELALVSLATLVQVLIGLELNIPVEIKCAQVPATIGNSFLLFELSDLEVGRLVLDDTIVLRIVLD